MNIHRMCTEKGAELKEESGIVVKEVLIESVRVAGRYRRDLGDVKPLADSIAQVGLIHPVTIAESGDLIAGQRRLEAYRLLGRETIPARIVSDLTAAVERLTIERDENTARKAMTPEELVSLGRALETLEQPKAEERRREGNARGGAGKSVENSPPTSSPGPTREVVAGALGWSSFTYNRAKAVVAAAEDTTLPPEEQQVARDALTQMNETGRVNGSYEKIRRARDARLGERRKPAIEDAKKQRHAISAAAATLGGVTLGLKQIDAIHPDITSEEAAQWVGDLSEARRAIEALIKRLKERTNVQA